MTIITTPTAPADSQLLEPPAPPDSGSGFLTATGQTARRTGLQFLRTPQLLILPTIMGALFLFIFRYIFGGAIDTGSGVDYVDFLVPGFLATTFGGFFLPLRDTACGGPCTSSDFADGLTPGDFLDNIALSNTLTSYWQVDPDKLEDIYFGFPGLQRVLNLLVWHQP